MLLSKVLTPVFSMPRSAKRLVALTLDASLCLITVWLAFYLRLGDWVPLRGNQWIAATASLAALPLLWGFGVYRPILRYMGFHSLGVLTRGCIVYGVLYAAVFTFLGVAGVPRTVGLIQPILFFLAAGAMRASIRLLVGRLDGTLEETRVLIYGAGASGRQLAAAITGGSEMKLVGFVDDDPTLHGAVLAGQPIISPSRLPEFIARRDVTDILLAMPSVSRRAKREIADSLRHLPVKVRTLPGLMDLASGRVEISTLRPLEIEDLLGRDVASPNEILFARNIYDKVVLVTGAGGSIGSELTRQILSARPRTLLLLEISEFALYAIEAELRKTLDPDVSTEIIPLIGSVTDEPRLEAIFAAWAPQTIYHAAAYKHVPLVEHNPLIGILNNAYGTHSLAACAIRHNVLDFVLISTDKAVRPTNVMGATKRLAELILQAYAEDGASTRFSIVRFGNVLGSSGSVVPLFRQQIAGGGPVTVTDPDVTRYFMTIREAAQLVIQAGAMATGGDVFVLDMGDPVRIIDLAERMIELSGMSRKDADNPDGDIEIQVVGLRPGEKRYEELLIGGDPQPTHHPLIMRAIEPHIGRGELEAKLERLSAVIEAGDGPAALRELQAIVEDYSPASPIVDWVELRRSRAPLTAA